MAKSGGSLSANVVHLFRHLSEPDVLRSNPLVADIFATAAGATVAERNAAAIADVRRRIDRCAELCEQLDAGTRYETRGKRHRAMIVRCDLAGEQHENVARELGICIRHFYRERRAAQQRVAQLLGEQRPQPKAVVLDAHEAAIAHATMLAELGYSRAAVGELETMAASASGGTKIRDLALLSGTLLNFGRIEQARAALRMAASQTGERASGMNAVVEQLWLRMTEAELLSECGAFAESDRAYAETETLLRRASSIRTNVACDAVIRASRALAFRAYKRGASSQAQAHASSGLRVLAQSSQLPLFVREGLTHVQTLSLYQLGAIGRDETEHRVHELLRFAQSAGALEQSASLLCTLSVLTTPPVSEAYRSQANELARRHGSTSMQRHIHLATAMWRLVEGNPLQAIAEMNEARKHGIGDVGQQILALDIESRATLFCGNANAALTPARRAHRLAAMVGDQRARGATMRTMAMVELRLGHLRDASDLISEAIPVITSYGSPSSLNLAIAVRESIDRSAKLAP
jgi:hypothetical protein